jgi:hypothetical protein
MADQQRILGIAGSLRRNSYNRALLRAATELVPAGMTIETYERVLKNAIDRASRPPQTPPLENESAASMSVSTRQSVAGLLAALATWARRFSAPIVVVLTSITLGACSKAPAGGAPITAPTPVTTKPAAPPPPPPTFVKTTSETRTTRLIDVRDGMTKAQLFRTVSDWLTQKYSIDVSDQRAGFLMTPWQASYLRDGLPDLHYRTRVIIRFVGDDWKQVSARAEANWQQGDEWEIGYDQQLLEDVVVELRTRLGKRS